MLVYWKIWKWQNGRSHTTLADLVSAIVEERGPWIQAGARHLAVLDTKALLQFREEQATRGWCRPSCFDCFSLTYNPIIVLYEMQIAEPKS